MPKLYQNQHGGYFTKPRIDNRMVTLQITLKGAKWLINSGYEVGDELGAAYWDLHEQGWLYTRGEFDGGGLVEAMPGFIPNEALTPFTVESTVNPDEPLTIRTHDAQTNAPLFLYSPTGVYYTILSVENSSDYWLEVPLLIKHHGAVELIEMGAEVGAEFTEAGLRTIFERRWGYFDDERFPD